MIRLIFFSEVIMEKCDCRKVYPDWLLFILESHSSSTKKVDLIMVLVTSLSFINGQFCYKAVATVSAWENWVRF